MTNHTLEQISISAEHTGAPTQSSGTIAGIIVGCVALLALISALTALCYWWKSSGTVRLPAFPAKCYTISSGKHTPGTCVPGQEGGRGAEDSTFMLNYMTHNYIDPMQDNVDVDVDNDSFLNSLESSIHFSNSATGTTATSGCSQNCPYPSDAYFRQKFTTSALMGTEAQTSGSAFNAVHRYHERSYNDNAVDRQIKSATTSLSSSQRHARGIQAGVAILPRQLSNDVGARHPSPIGRPTSRERSRPNPNVYALDRGQSLITTYDDRGQTDTLAMKTVNVFQYPPPMAPINLFIRK